MAYLFQLVLNIILPLVMEAFFEMVLGWDEVQGYPFGKVGTQIVKAALIALVALLIGYILTARYAPLSRHGRLAFIPLSIVLLAGIISDLIRFHSDSTGILDDFFYWRHPGADEPSILIYFITYPALSSIAYSLGAFLRKKTTKEDLVPSIR